MKLKTKRVRRGLPKNKWFSKAKAKLVCGAWTGPCVNACTGCISAYRQKMRVEPRVPTGGSSVR